MNAKSLMAILVGGALASASTAAAHDFFLLPQQFEGGTKDPVHIQATIGSSFPTPEIVVPADRVESLRAISSGEPQIEVVGQGPKALELHLRGAKHGVVAVAVTSKPRDVEYSEDRVPLILEEYRVAAAAAAAVEALPRPRTWLVTSRRFAKTFLCVQTCEDRAAVDRSFGAKLEFVGHASSQDHFRLLASGQPLGEYPVDLVSSDGQRLHLTTDKQGDIHLPSQSRGTMMLFAAKLQPPAGEGRFTLDLTSLTFKRSEGK